MESERPERKASAPNRWPLSPRDSRRRQDTVRSAVAASGPSGRLPFRGQSVALGNRTGGVRGLRVHPAAKDPGGDPSGVPDGPSLLGRGGSVVKLADGMPRSSLTASAPRETRPASGIFRD